MSSALIQRILGCFSPAAGRFRENKKPDVSRLDDWRNRRRVERPVRSVMERSYRRRALLSFVRKRTSEADGPLK